MQHLHLTSADGTALRAARWTPEGEVKADILLCHGLAEHMGRYDYLGSWFAERGYRVTGIELRGHGRSAGRRGHVRRWQNYVDDLSAAASQIDGPHFLLAHSMGGLVSLDYARNARNLRGIVISGALLGVAVDAPKWKVLAGRVLSRIIPFLPMKNELDPNSVCGDPDIVAAYVADPLVFDVITPRWFTEMTKAMKRVHANAPNYRVPLLSMWGTGDVVVGLPENEDFVSRYGAEATAHPWHGLLHEIFNEKQRDEVLAEAFNWMEAH